MLAADSPIWQEVSFGYERLKFPDSLFDFSGDPEGFEPRNELFEELNCRDSLCSGTSVGVPFIVEGLRSASAIETKLSIIGCIATIERNRIIDEIDLSDRPEVWQDYINSVSEAAKIAFDLLSSDLPLSTVQSAAPLTLCILDRGVWGLVLFFELCDGGGASLLCGNCGTEHYLFDFSSEPKSAIRDQTKTPELQSPYPVRLRPIDDTNGSRSSRELTWLAGLCTRTDLKPFVDRARIFYGHSFCENCEAEFPIFSAIERPTKNKR